jgi:O-methyltransferase
MAQSLLNDTTLEVLCGIAAACPPGAFVEFGVYKGGAAEKLADIARAQGRLLYLYDTFEGIPFKGPHDSHNVGDFCDTSVDEVRALIPDAVIVPGVFPESLIAMEPIAFVHVDADQYESVAAAIRVFPPLMVRRGVMVFDDYKCLDGATRAIEEWGEPFRLTAQGKAMWRKA